MTETSKPQFEVILLGIIFDPKERKILLGRRENDSCMKNLTWCFPGGRLNYNEGLDKTLKAKIKLKTGLDVKNLGAVFANTSPELPKTLLIYFLCEAFQGDLQPGDDLVELEWVKPVNLEEFRGRPLNSRLKEYLMNIA